jgi:hypothetical protein
MYPILTETRSIQIGQVGEQLCASMSSQGLTVLVRVNFCHTTEDSYTWNIREVKGQSKEYR